MGGASALTSERRWAEAAGRFGSPPGGHFPDSKMPNPQTTARREWLALGDGVIRVLDSNQLRSAWHRVPA